MWRTSVNENVVMPTCTERGSHDAVFYCLICGNEWEREEVTTPALGHRWGEWTQTKAPTCSAAGLKERTCKNDASHKETEEVAIDPDAHDWGEWVVTREASETEEGSETRTCKYDPSHTETRTIPAGIAYRNVSGDGNVWHKGSDVTSDFAFKRSTDDAKASDAKSPDTTASDAKASDAKASGAKKSEAAAKSPSSSPKTGDPFQLVVVVLAAVAIAAGVTAFAVALRRRREC